MENTPTRQGRGVSADLFFFSREEKSVVKKEGNVKEKGRRRKDKGKINVKPVQK
jgi:hypothetical protein